MFHGCGRRARAALIAAVAVSLLLSATTAAAYVPPPEEDPFYRYEGSTPLAQIPPGSVLKTRTFSSYHIAGLPTPVRVVQLLYRSIGALGEPTVNVTSVLIPPLVLGEPKVVSYQSFYDSLNPREDPSYKIALEASEPPKLSLQSPGPDSEELFIAPFLLAGDTVVVTDIEGEEADFAAGPVYGFNTIFGIQAALNSPQTGLAETHKIAMIGYSGGAIGTGWGVELAPAYDPAVNARLVGASMGGVLVDPLHNLHYIEGSEKWSGVMPMALIGIGRAYHIDVYQYANRYGTELFNRLQKAGIGEAEGHYPGLTWSQIAKRQYPFPESIPQLVEVANQLIMGSDGTPTAPLLITQGAGGEQEGTPGYKPGIGPGDGVMIAGDVRSLAREYCERGVKLDYREYKPLDHTQTAIPWFVETLLWVQARFLGLPAPQNCGSIPPGNSLEPSKPLGPSEEEDPQRPAPATSQAAAPAASSAPAGTPDRSTARLERSQRRCHRGKACRAAHRRAVHHRRRARKSRHRRRRSRRR